MHQITNDWTVIGAGPAGIAAVGKLIDNGIAAEKINWIDPKFTVGDFGVRWRNVPSNTKAELFLKFLEASPAFNYDKCPIDFALNNAPRSKTCFLHLMAEPLTWVTQQLKKQVNSIEDFASKLVFKNRSWQIYLKNSVVHSKNIILATGADSKNLSLTTLPQIPLDVGLDKEKLQKELDGKESIAVFGSSHSAILVLRNLIELGANNIVNFFLAPLVYAVYMDDWILFDDTGLKGSTAEWAREHLSADLPNNLIRVSSNQKNLDEYLPQCNKVIYATGFQRRLYPVIENLDQVNYLPQSGIIAPGLFGVGIGFPEAKYDRLGHLEYRVGLWKFMDYLQRVLPIWLRYSP